MSDRWVGIFALDPGTTSGIDVGFWRTNCRVEEAVNSYEGFVDELTGSIEDQARTLCELYTEFFERDSSTRKFIVIESYTQRPTPHFVKAESLDPIRVAYMMIGRLTSLFDPSDRIVNWQSPSEAMTYATDGRLREWGAWVKGKEHGRDARRHALAFRSAIER